MVLPWVTIQKVVPSHFSYSIELLIPKWHWEVISKCPRVQLSIIHTHIPPYQIPKRDKFILSFASTVIPPFFGTHWIGLIHLQFEIRFITSALIPFIYLLLYNVLHRFVNSSLILNKWCTIFLPLDLFMYICQWNIDDVGNCPTYSSLIPFQYRYKRLNLIFCQVSCNNNWKYIALYQTYISKMT